MDQSDTVVQSFIPTRRRLHRPLLLLPLPLCVPRSCELHKRTQKPCPRLISHIVIRSVVTVIIITMSCVYRPGKDEHRVSPSICARRLFSIRASSPIHTANKVFITCSFNIFKCEHVPDYPQPLLPLLASRERRVVTLCVHLVINSHAELNNKYTHMPSLQPSRTSYCRAQD